MKIGAYNGAERAKHLSITDLSFPRQPLVGDPGKVSFSCLQSPPLDVDF
jgi:hypothetical protein